MEEYSFKVPETCSENKCHLMPFSLEYEGQAPNGLCAERGAPGEWSANFRGRELRGREIDLLDYVAVELEGQGSKRYRGVQALEKYILYEHGSSPREGDPYGVRMTELLEMAKSISS